MRSVFLRTLLFFISSFLQLHLAEAKGYTIPSEEPQDCVKKEISPCSLVTGNEPRMFLRSGHRYELDRNTVLHFDGKNSPQFFQGLMVISSVEGFKIHTPFADILLGESKVMIHVLENKVRVLSLAGEGVKVISRGAKDDPQFLLPGFQNWYSGIDLGVSDYGVVSVILLSEYSQMRSRFFLNYSEGFRNELIKVAGAIKWAAKIASQFHRLLIERKVASLDNKHNKSVKKEQQKIEYNHHLRRLFLKKIRYDY